MGAFKWATPKPSFNAERTGQAMKEAYQMFKQKSNNIDPTAFTTPGLLGLLGLERYQTGLTPPRKKLRDLRLSVLSFRLYAA
jgi:hypothetical protein